jgi:hypothetical protein
MKMKTKKKTKMESHRVHHYDQLVRRWRAVAREAGVRLHRFAFAGADPLFFVKTPALGSAGGIYISAAIHGDEPPRAKH